MTQPLPPQGAKAVLSPFRGYFKTGPSGPGFLLPGCGVPLTGLITGYAGTQARMQFFLGGEMRIELVRFIGDLRMFSRWDYSA